MIIQGGVKRIGNEAFLGCSGLTSIKIPSSVRNIGDWAFERCSSLTIYCVAKRQPHGWHSYWNPDKRPVVWGYKGKKE